MVMIDEVMWWRYETKNMVLTVIMTIIMNGTNLKLAGDFWEAAHSYATSNFLMYQEANFLKNVKNQILHNTKKLEFRVGFPQSIMSQIGTLYKYEWRNGNKKSI